MAEFYGDSHGERWGVMMQQRKTSCGLACAAMAEVYMKSQVAANMEAIFRAISQKFPENFVRTAEARQWITSSTYFGTAACFATIITIMVQEVFGRTCMLTPTNFLR